MTYVRLLAMIVASTVLMFGLMYSNTYAIDHVFFSQTRAWMAVVMGAAMAVLMLGFMWEMYKGTGTKGAITVASVAIFAGSLWLVRSQETVDDVSYMKAMIPHHSIAILTSRRAHISDPRVRKLADGIIEAQVREIGEMKQLIADLETHPLPGREADLPPVQQSLARPMPGGDSGPASVRLFVQGSQMNPPAGCVVAEGDPPRSSASRFNALGE